VGPAREAGKATGAEAQPDVQLQAAQIQRESEQRIREAHAAGTREGEAAGRARAAAELQPVIDRLGRSIDELAGLRARLRSEAEADLVKLSLAIARRVLRRELAIDPEALHGLVLAALEKLQGQEICRVKVHPSHAALVTECLRQIVTGAPVEVIPDPSREPGAIVFETARGNLDASVESQLQEIERGLVDLLKRPS
jgi:flagellar assembly protein FliH